MLPVQKLEKMKKYIRYIPQSYGSCFDQMNCVASSPKQIGIFKTKNVKKV